MNGSVIALDDIGGREAAAMLVDGRLVDLLVAGPATALPGTIYRAIADRPLKGLGAMMLRLTGGASGYLREAVGLKPGSAILVQVTGHAEDGKAVPVTAKVLFKSRYCIVTPDAPGINVSRAIKDEDLRESLLAVATMAMQGSAHGLILRTLCETGEDEVIAKDIAEMRDLAVATLALAQGREPELLVAGAGPHAMAWREWPAPDQLDDEAGAFQRHNVIEQVQSLAFAKVGLGGGAFAYIEPTKALVAVDVNTGADISPAAALKANLALAKDLPRQLRLRGLGGQITVDFAPISKRDRLAVESALKSAFKADSIDTALAGWTPLGHFELQRKRERQPIDFGALA
jgi:ribonuclease G